MSRLLPFMVLLVVASSAARGNAEHDLEQAYRHQRSGQSLFAQESYKEALQEFEAALVLRPLPTFFRDVARCHDRLGHVTEAIAAYEQFIATAGSSSEVRAARVRLDALRAGLDLEPPPETRARERPRRSLTLPISVGSGALALAAVGAALLVSVADPYAALRSQWQTGPSVELQNEARSLEGRADAGYVLLGLAGAAAIADVVLWALAASREPAPRAWVVPTATGLTARVTF